MTRDEVKNKVIHAVAKVQRDSGRPAPDIGGSTVPLRHLKGFDSMNALEAGLTLSPLVNRDVDVYDFYSKEKKRELSIDEIAKNLYYEMTSEGGATNE